MDIKVLVLAAHHDDETLGVGATIARLSAEGHEVHVLVLGEGPASRPGTDARKAVDQFHAAVTHLGAKPCQCVAGADLALPDNKFDTKPLQYVAFQIECAIAFWKPEVIYTHHAGDLNQDHRAVAKATVIATRPFCSSVKEVYAYEVPSSTEWAFGSEATFQPNVFQPITPEQLDRKIAAMQMYETERRAFPHPRSPEALRALAMYRGSQSGLLAAEAFQLVRVVR